MNLLPGVALASAVVISAAGAPSATLAAPTARSAAASPVACGDLAHMAIPTTNLLSASVVSAADGRPEYCRVAGFVRPAINFELRLPTHGWNHKFLMAGCGGFCGGLLTEAPG